MAQAFLITVATAGLAPCPGGLRYAALAETPEAAVAIVRSILSPGKDVHWTGDTLSTAASRAVGLRPGQARLV